MTQVKINLYMTYYMDPIFNALLAKYVCYEFSIEKS